jgi:hypothetical protein
MRIRWIGLALGAMAVILGIAAPATAQSPWTDNYLRAYTHFAGSRYSYRTLSSFAPGAGGVMATPFVYQSQFIEPAFSRQRIMPYGYDRFDVVPGFGGMTMTPFGFSRYYVPGYSYGYYLPYAR